MKSMPKSTSPSHKIIIKTEEQVIKDLDKNPIQVRPIVSNPPIKATPLIPLSK